MPISLQRARGLTANVNPEGRASKLTTSDDDCRNGNDSAPQPIRKNAKAKYRQTYRESDFGKD
jgi:hypothetical protein